jgi:hypothetical protein
MRCTWRPLPSRQTPYQLRFPVESVRSFSDPVPRARVVLLALGERDPLRPVRDDDVTTEPKKQAAPRSLEGPQSA